MCLKPYTSRDHQLTNPDHQSTSPGRGKRKLLPGREPVKMISTIRRMKKPQQVDPEPLSPGKEQRRSRHVLAGVSRVVIYLRHLLFPSLYYTHYLTCHNCCSRISHCLESLDINRCLLENNTHQMDKSNRARSNEGTLGSQFSSP